MATNEAFFLNEAWLSRAVCLKNLGRMSEYERAKAEVPAGTTTLIDDAPGLKFLLDIAGRLHHWGFGCTLDQPDRVLGGRGR